MGPARKTSSKGKMARRSKKSKRKEGQDRLEGCSVLFSWNNWNPKSNLSPTFLANGETFWRSCPNTVRGFRTVAVSQRVFSTHLTTACLTLRRRACLPGPTPRAEAQLQTCHVVRLRHSHCQIQAYLLRFAIRYASNNNPSFKESNSWLCYNTLRVLCFIKVLLYFLSKKCSLGAHLMC